MFAEDPRDPPVPTNCTRVCEPFLACAHAALEAATPNGTAAVLAAVRPCALTLEGVACTSRAVVEEEDMRDTVTCLNSLNTTEGAVTRMRTWCQSCASAAATNQAEELRQAVALRFGVGVR